MKINQLFKASIPEDFFLKVCICYGIKNFEDEYYFSKTDLIKLGTVSSLLKYKEELMQYYLPCKAKLYLIELNESKAITILRQLLRLFNKILLSKQKYIKQKKTTLYYISNINDSHFVIDSIRVDNHEVTLSFE